MPYKLSLCHNRFESLSTPLRLGRWTYMNAKSHADLGRGKSTPAQRDAECPTSDEKFKMDLKKSQKAQDAYAAPGSAPQGQTSYTGRVRPGET